MPMATNAISHRLQHRGVLCLPAGRSVVISCILLTISFLYSSFNLQQGIWVGYNNYNHPSQHPKLDDNNTLHSIQKQRNNNNHSNETVLITAANHPAHHDIHPPHRDESSHSNTTITMRNYTTTTFTSRKDDQIQASAKNTSSSTAVTIKKDRMAPALFNVPNTIDPQPLNVSNESKNVSTTRVCDIFANRNASMTIPLSRVPKIFPKPSLDAHDIISIYSKTAWSKLRNKLTNSVSSSSSSSASSSSPSVMVVSGGSVSCGIGTANSRHTYFDSFAKGFPNLTIVDRAHGGRYSLHTAHLMHSFLPMHTDIVLWEFSVNDINNQLDNSPVMKVEARNQLILWLEQLVFVTKQRGQIEPPLVVLVYLWNCYQFEPEAAWDVATKNLVFEGHQLAGQAYDFVVGHINVGLYVESFGCNIMSPSFMNDMCHANELGHELIRYLLDTLVTDENREERPRNTSQQPPVYHWQCGNQTHEKELVRHLIEQRHPIASFSHEEPKNTELLPGMLFPTVSGTMETRNFGKVVEWRSDRKFSVNIPCCGVDQMSFMNLSQYGVVKGLQIHLNSEEQGTFNLTDLNVMFDDVEVTSLFIDTRNIQEWPCFASYYFPYQYWVILEEDRRMSTIHICDNQVTCNATTPAKSALWLNNFIVFGV